MSHAHIVTLVICSLVAFGVVLGLWGGLSRARRILADLRPGGDLARSLASHPAPEAAFTHRWPELDSAFRSARALTPAWAAYSASVTTSTQPDGSGAIASTVAPEDCLKLSRLAGGPWEDVRVARLSGLLVTLGIFGTFIGLTLGLVEADFASIQAIVEADEKTEALQSAMFGLLAGSSTAFVTSVAGLAGSLILTVVVRQMASRAVATELSATAAALRAGIRVEPPDQRLSQHLDRLTRHIEESADLSPILERIARATEAVQRGGRRPVAEEPVASQPAPSLREAADARDFASSAALVGISKQLSALQGELELLREALTPPSEPPQQEQPTDPGEPPPPAWATRLADAVEALSQAPSPADTLTEPLQQLIATLDRPPPPPPAWAMHLDARLSEPPPTPAWVPELRAAITQLSEPPAEPEAPPEPAWAVALAQATEKLSEPRPAPHADQLARIIALLSDQRTTLTGLRATMERAAQPAPPSAELAEVVHTLRALQAALSPPAAEPDVRPAVEAAEASGQALMAAIAPGIDQVQDVADRFAQASLNFDRATTRLDAAARSNHDAADTLRQATDQLGTRLQVLQQATAAMRTGLAHHTDASNALTSAAASLQSVGPQLTRSTDQIRLSTSSVELTVGRLAALQQASGGPEIARLVPVLEALLTTLEQRR